MRKMYKENGDFTLSIEPGDGEFFAEVFPVSPPSHFSNAIDELIERYSESDVRVHVIFPVTSDDDIASVLPHLNVWARMCGSFVFDVDLHCVTNLECLLEALNNISIPCDKHVSFSSPVGDVKGYLDRIRDFTAGQQTAFFVRCCDLDDVSGANLDHLLADIMAANIKVIEFDRDHHSTFDSATYRQFLSEIYDLHRRHFDAAYVDYFPSWKSALWPIFFHELGRIRVQHLPADQYGCSLGRRTVAFDSSGKQIPCGRFHKMSGEALPEKLMISLPSKCFGCPVYNFCEGGCKALGFRDGQTTHDPHCWR